ncbi:hypothetical protein [Enterococcus hirae]|uniref:hypothetical protein n=1 Tax=Enterococcus hirae TaxID=1354 RepID=UPI0013719219|nr:hypothetical protein [Enterococcus hirae]NAE18241.1 hypothetical protein [Enterococcus hirae]
MVTALWILYIAAALFEFAALYAGFRGGVREDPNNPDTLVLGFERPRDAYLPAALVGLGILAGAVGNIISIYAKTS